jgi:hypothetical protein
MGLPDWNADPADTAHEHDGRHVQLWRLSDLKLLRTIELPALPDSRAHRQPAEPRRMESGDVFVVTMECGMFRITGLDGETFGAELVHDFAGTDCAVPVTTSRFWIQSVGSAKSVVVLDTSNASSPVEISRVRLDAAQAPHWLSLDPRGGRLIAVNNPRGERRIWMLTLDGEGHLSLDTRFRDAGSDRPGLSFDREEWPHGRTGAAIPHGSVFAK